MLPISQLIYIGVSINLSEILLFLYYMMSNVPYSTQITLVLYQNFQWSSYLYSKEIVLSKNEKA